MENEINAVGYVRVSTEGQAQDGISLEAQEAKIRAYCDLNGMELLHVYADRGLSGKRADNRPELQEALAMIDSGQAGALVVYKLDRLARCTIDALEIAKSLDKRGASLHSLGEKLDTSSAMGKFFFTLVASLAEMERGIIAKRTADIPLGKLIEPEDIARAVLFFCSPLADMITGQSIAVDGGSGEAVVY